ncbi:MAG: DUF4157 domain-containing protein [Pyrinomonadaceae bacterium]
MQKRLKPEELPENIIRILSPYFPNVDLSRVRISIGIPALLRRAARIPPVAITIGRRIYFAHRGAGGFDPDTFEGIELIAHELTHVRQFRAFKTRAGFGLSYLGEYRRHRATGKTEHEAYSSISYEVEAKENAARIVRDIRDRTKSTD